MFTEGKKKKKKKKEIRLRGGIITRMIYLIII